MAILYTSLVSKFVAGLHVVVVIIYVRNSLGIQGLLWFALQVLLVRLKKLNCFLLFLMHRTLTIRCQWERRSFYIPSCYFLLTGIDLSDLGGFMCIPHGHRCRVSRSRGDSTSLGVACFPFCIIFLYISPIEL